ncbi:MAG: tetratricopeptide repeat protein [Bacteroidales bacterium]|jgi:tetratricopeptide (TPR) repeat protein|nr:tetratricopeptide repeat protein [Bacteroidales bacterium]
MRILLLSVYLLFSHYILNAQQVGVRELKPFVNIEKGMYAEAIDSLTQLISTENNTYYLDARINAFIKVNDLDKALIDCELMEKKQKGSSAILQTKIYLLKKDIANAEKTLLNNLKSTHKISLYELLTDAEFRKIQDSEFMDSILKTNIYSSTEKQIYKVEKYINNGNYNEAFFLANEIINRNPNIADAYYFLSKIYFQNTDLVAAKSTIDKAIELNSSTIDFYQHRIAVNQGLKNYTELLSDVNRVLKINPYKVDFYLLRSEVLLHNSKFDEAIKQADFYLELYPQNSNALYIKASSYFQKGENLDALKYINESLENTKSVRQYELRGDIYMNTATFHFAEMDYSMALDLDARNGEMWTKKGFARYQSGNKTGACADWQKGKRYGSIAAIEYLEKFCK